MSVAKLVTVDFIDTDDGVCGSGVGREEGDVIQEMVRDGGREERLGDSWCSKAIK